MVHTTLRSPRRVPACCRGPSVEPGASGGDGTGNSCTAETAPGMGQPRTVCNVGATRFERATSTSRKCCKRRPKTQSRLGNSRSKRAPRPASFLFGSSPYFLRLTCRAGYGCGYIPTSTAAAKARLPPPHQHEPQRLRDLRGGRERQVALAGHAEITLSGRNSRSLCDSLAPENTRQTRPKLLADFPLLAEPIGRL